MLRHFALVIRRRPPFKTSFSRAETWRSNRCWSSTLSLEKLGRLLSLIWFLFFILPTPVWACTNGNIVYNTGTNVVEWCYNGNYVSADAGKTSAGGGGTATVFLTSGTSWVVPSDWSGTNKVEAIGGGAGGYSANGTNQPGGGGGGPAAPAAPLLRASEIRPPLPAVPGELTSVALHLRAPAAVAPAVPMAMELPEEARAAPIAGPGLAAAAAASDSASKSRAASALPIGQWRSIDIRHFPRWEG